MKKVVLKNEEWLTILLNLIDLEISVRKGECKSFKDPIVCGDLIENCRVLLAEKLGWKEEYGDKRYYD